MIKLISKLIATTGLVIIISYVALLIMDKLVR